MGLLHRSTPDPLQSTLDGSLDLTDMEPKSEGSLLRAKSLHM